VVVTRGSGRCRHQAGDGARRGCPFSTKNLVRRPGDQPALVTGARQFDLGGLARAIAAGDGCRSVWGAADDFAQGHLPLAAVWKPDDGHTEVQQVGDDREQSRFLAAVLSRGVVDEGRIVRDGNILSGGGVTAGIDFVLALIAELRGSRVAEMVQLGLEYAPQPPFDSGRPDTAPAEVLEAVNARTAAAFAERRVRIDAWAAAHRVGQHA
jgi:hypothetical protein